MNESALEISESARVADRAVRAICRAVIRRVCDEHPESFGYELFLRLWAAYPFGALQGSVEQLWLDEVLAAVGDVNMITATMPVKAAHGSSPREWIQ